MTDAEKVASLQAALLETEARLARLGELELELREVTTRAVAEVDAARRERDEAVALLETVRAELRAVYASPSWKLSKPVRALKR